MRFRAVLELHGKTGTGFDVPEAVVGARDAFDALSYTYRKEHVRSVESATAAETRTRRIAKILDALIPT